MAEFVLIHLYLKLEPHHEDIAFKQSYRLRDRLWPVELLSCDRAAGPASGRGSQCPDLYAWSHRQ
jgi:hypothetical protein